MPLAFNCPSSSARVPTFLAMDVRGKGCTFSQTRAKKVKKKYKNGCKKSQEFSNVQSKFALTPALVSILESLGYKVRK